MSNPPAASINYAGSQKQQQQQPYPSGYTPVSIVSKGSQPQTNAPPGFGTTYNMQQMSEWAMLGHPEYAGVYPPPTIPESVTGMAYPLSASSALKSGYAFTDFKEVNNAGITSLQYGFYTPAQTQEIANAKVAGPKGPTGIGALGKTMLLSPEEAGALASKSGVKVFQVEEPKLARQAEVAGLAAATFAVPEILPLSTAAKGALAANIISSELGSVGISEGLNLATGKGLLNPASATESLVLGGVTGAGVSGIAGSVTSQAAKTLLISSLGAGLGYVTGGPKGAIVGGLLLGGGYLVASGLQGAAEEWLSGKVAERFGTSGPSLGEKIVSGLTGAKPSLAYGVVEIPQSELADAESFGTPRVNLKAPPDLTGFQSWTDPYATAEPYTVKASPQDLSGWGMSEKDWAALSLEDKIAYRALTPKDVPLEQMPPDFLAGFAGKNVKTFEVGPVPSGQMQSSVMDEFDISVAPRTSGLLMSKMPADTLASQWATEHLVKSMYGGIAYASVKEALAADTRKLPYTPNLPSTEELGDIAFTPLPLERGSQVQVELPKVKPTTESAMPYIPKVDLLPKQETKQTPFVDVFQTPTVENILSPDVAQAQVQNVAQVQEQKQVQEQQQILAVPNELRTTQTSEFMPRLGSPFDWRKQPKKPIRLGGGFTSVFRGWPVRKPEQILKTEGRIKSIGSFSMGKPSTPKLVKQISEERKSSQKYRRWGYPQIAKQETAHRKKLEAELKKRQNKRR